MNYSPTLELTNNMTNESTEVLITLRLPNRVILKLFIRGLGELFTTPNARNEYYLCASVWAS
jgi:hypothetical protein